MIDSTSNLVSLSEYGLPSNTPSEYSSGLSTYTMLARQKDVIRAIFYNPGLLSKYINYTGLDNVEFKGLNVPIPPVPFIPYNDNSFCCLLNKIVGVDSKDETEDTCRTLSVTALGAGGKIGVPYIIKDEDGTELVVKLSKVNKAYSRYDINPPTNLREIDSLGIKQCISKIKLSRIRYLASDEFTNETLIGYTLNLVAEELSLPPLYVRHYQGAICSDPITSEDFGLNIMENCDLGSLDKVPNHPNFKQYIKQHHVNDNGREILSNLVDSDIIFQIITQITMGLHMLQNYVGFISGDLKAGNIFVKSEPINMEYMGIKLKAPFICKIADYGKSSCMLPRVNGTLLRFYHESILSNIYLAVHPFTPEIIQSDDEYYYTVDTPLVSQTYSRTMHMGIPFYRSFDYYTVLVSMLTRPAFYYMFFSTESLRKTFWDPIWINSAESDEVLSRIHQYVMEGKGERLADAITIVKGIKLKCGAVNLVINNLLSLQ